MLYRIVLILAYIHQVQPAYLKGRLLPFLHLSALRLRLHSGQVQEVRSIRDDPVLITIFALLMQAELLTTDNKSWSVSTTLRQWLEANKDDFGDLVAHISFDQVEEALKVFNLDQSIDATHLAYVKQQISRPITDFSDLPSFFSGEDGAWKVLNLQKCDLNLLFDLLQIGEWHSDHSLSLTQFTIMQAALGGQSLFGVNRLVKRATDYTLTDAEFRILAGWIEAKDDFELSTNVLLKVKKGEDLHAMLGNRTLSKHVLQQLTPNYLLVNDEIGPALTAWLAKQDRVLNRHVQWESPADLIDITTAEYSWLALKVLAKMGDFTKERVNAPSPVIERLQAVIPAYRLGILKILADKIEDDFKRVVRGTDVFQPAAEPVAPELVQMLESAVRNDRLIEIHYQTLVEKGPHIRQVRPFRIEQRGTLQYLFAYCSLVNDNRQFRLDRIKFVELVKD